jgi:hypothetical protein
LQQESSLHCSPPCIQMCCIIYLDSAVFMHPLVPYWVKRSLRIPAITHRVYMQQLHSKRIFFYAMLIKSSNRERNNDVKYTMEHSSGKSMVSKGWTYKAKRRNYLSVSHTLPSLIPSLITGKIHCATMRPTNEVTSTIKLAPLTTRGKP